MDMTQKRKKALSVDDQLAEHLREAETHLIGAVNLFAHEKKLDRRVGYLTRLVRSQETVTALHREELVRMRGPQRRPRGLKGVKRG